MQGLSGREGENRIQEKSRFLRSPAEKLVNVTERKRSACHQKSRTSFTFRAALAHSLLLKENPKSYFEAHAYVISAEPDKRHARTLG